MPTIATYVFLDLETTGLPHLERNKTKIVELSLVAALRSDLKTARIGSKPFISKLSLLFNPQRNIQARAAEITGISNELVQNAPVFGEKIGTIQNFLEELPKPVCLVAHNGDRFDFKILLAELFDINTTISKDILCVDSLRGFQSILKGPTKRDFSMIDSNDSGWSEFEISNEDLKIIDELCESFSELPSVQSTPKKKPAKVVRPRQSYKLVDIYRTLLNKEPFNAHRAEDDCIMLLESVVACKEFLHWSENNCKHLCNIEPLDRKRYDVNF